MAILIKGMEMPRTCYDCKFRKRNGLELICPVLEKSYKIADTQVLFVREKDCPLIEVPEPHGDLIDMNAKIDVYDRYDDDIIRQTTVRGLINEYISGGYPSTVIPASEEE